MRTVVAGVVLLFAAVSGCSAADEGEPAEVAPLASGTASPSAAYEAEVPSPDLATASGAADPSAELIPEHPETVDGASAFAREYVRLIAQAFTDARPDMVRQRSAPGCEGCDALIGAMERAAAEGLKQRGGDYSISSVATPPIEDGDVVLLLTYTRTASEVVDAAGAVIERAPAVPETTIQMRLVYGVGGWRTQGYRIV